MPKSNDDWWDRVRRSASLIRGLPAWTGAGILLSENFEGGVKSVPCKHCNGTGKEYRWAEKDVAR